MQIWYVMSARFCVSPISSNLFRDFFLSHHVHRYGSLCKSNTTNKHPIQYRFWRLWVRLAGLKVPWLQSMTIHDLNNLMIDFLFYLSIFGDCRCHSRSGCFDGAHRCGAALSFARPTGGRQCGSKAAASQRCGHVAQSSGTKCCQRPGQRVKRLNRQTHYILRCRHWANVGEKQQLFKLANIYLAPWQILGFEVFLNSMHSRSAGFC